MVVVMVTMMTVVAVVMVVVVIIMIGYKAPATVATIQWHSMAFDGIQWHSMAFNSTQWHSMAFNEWHIVCWIVEGHSDSCYHIAVIQHDSIPTVTVTVRERRHRCIRFPTFG
jgi:hypothetical protein